MPDFDVIVIGAGNAAMAAAVSAREQGAQRVVMLEAHASRYEVEYPAIGSGGAA